MTCILSQLCVIYCLSANYIFCVQFLIQASSIQDVLFILSKKIPFKMYYCILYYESCIISMDEIRGFEGFVVLGL